MDGSNLSSGTCLSYSVLTTFPTDMGRQIYFEWENTKSRLFLTIGTVDAISRVQKEMTNMLNDEYMDMEEKLHIYNQLMSRSGVLINKARYIFSPELDVTPIPDNINEPVTIRGKK